MSPSVAEFWQLTPGTNAVIGLNGARQAVTAPAAGVLAFLPGMPPKTVSDRQGYVQARVDYLNYLMGANAYLVSDAAAPMLSDLQVLMPRVVVLLRTTPGTDDSRLRRRLAQATSVPPLELHSLAEEVQKVGNDMYISLALANMRIYLAGGLLLALVAIVAVAVANYTEDRRTLAMLRIRGASPPALWRLLLATLLAPALLGLAIGAAAAGARRIRPRKLRLAVAGDAHGRATAADAPGRAAAHRWPRAPARRVAGWRRVGVQLVGVPAYRAHVRSGDMKPAARRKSRRCELIAEGGVAYGAATQRAASINTAASWRGRSMWP